jgi:hypothetical protein
MIARRRRFVLAIVLAVALLVTASIVISPIRHLILRTAGWALVVNDRVEPADAIVVTVDAQAAGVLEAADLVHDGVAVRVAVFGESPDAVVEKEFIRRGVAYENAAARSVRYLHALGVDNVELISPYVAGSEAAAPVLASWCDQHRFQAIILVTTSDHSRRVRRMVHRSIKGHSTTIMIRTAHYSFFDPDRWWQSRRGVRTEVVELEKLLSDIVRHPIS